jgi:hypothetical protein
MAKGAQHLADMQSAYQPNPENGKVIEVTGWEIGEIEKIIADFCAMYGLPVSALVVTRDGNRHFRISFPSDIEPTNFLFLVNYFRYPKDLSLTNRRIGVLGVAKLNRAFGIPDTSLNGMRAKIYVPANDKEFDNVYVQLDSGKAFKIPFTRLIWESVDDPRMPDEVLDAPKG